MSRAPPFPTNGPRRPRSPPQLYSSPPATAPLAINRERNPSRAPTPSEGRPQPQPMTASPSRPVRSGLRSRVPSTAGSVASYRDGTRTSTEESFSRPRAPSASGRSATGEFGEISPTQQAAVSAFRQAARRKASRDDVRDEERRREIEEEEVRQRRMRERSAARRQTNGRAKPGDIEGEF